jgi:carbonic anhydrase/acetyltransferase-like protein (isoleucine patch superfamily)
MGATILNGASVGAFCLVAAGTLIRENMLVPNRSLVVGIPARIAGVLTDEQIERMAAGSARYRRKLQAYSHALVAMDEPATRHP